MRFILALVYAATWLWPSAFLFAQQNQSPAQTVVLEGVVKSRKEYGPPGYGETPRTDPKVTIFVLRLTKATGYRQLGLPPDKERGGRLVSEVQLICHADACELQLRNSVGRRVTVRGEADQAAEPGAYLPVVFWVRELSSFSNKQHD